MLAVELGVDPDAQHDFDELKRRAESLMESDDCDADDDYDEDFDVFGE